MSSTFNIIIHFVFFRLPYLSSIISTYICFIYYVWFNFPITIYFAFDRLLNLPFRFPRFLLKIPWISKPGRMVRDSFASIGGNAICGLNAYNIEFTPCGSHTATTSILYHLLLGHKTQKCYRDKSIPPQCFIVVKLIIAERSFCTRFAVGMVVMRRYSPKHNRISFLNKIFSI